MTINLTVPQTMQELRPRITVVGVGGAGCNAVNNMINANLEGVDFLVLNTDGQALAHSLSKRKIQLGSTITQGLGAGSKPEIGRAAAEESLEEVMTELADCNMVFITAGMGGGTGTGGAPVIARAARERGILTVGVITKPFEFEGQKRMYQADRGIEELQAFVDTLIVIPNQNLFRLANERTTFADAFHMADTVLHQGVCGVTDLMIKPGQINLDFADIKTVMGEMGKAMMGTGEASGEARATQAAEAAINNPLLDDTTMKGANALLINVTGGLDMTLFEVDEAANRIRKEVDPDATIIFGSAFDEKLDGIMRVSVVATGIEAELNNIARPGLTKSVDLTGAPISTMLPNSMTAQETVEDKIVEKSPDVKKVFNSVDDITNQIASDAIDEILREETQKNEPMVTPETLPKKNPINNIIGSETNSPRDEVTSQSVSSNEPAEVSKVANLDLKNADEIEEERSSFIPAPPTNIPDEETVTLTSKPPIRKSSSLIQNISRLWSNKPVNKVQPSDRLTELDLNETRNRGDIAASILDLSREQKKTQDGEAQSDLSTPATDDELDIPAFLRRQAN